VFYFTLGQREGLQIGGVRGFAAAPWFVVGKDVPGNRLIVDQGTDSAWLQSQRLRSETAHWIAGAPPAARFACTAQTRYRQADEACEVAVREDGSLDVRFARPQRAVTPGQSLVLYRDELCLGGAVIAATDAALDPGREAVLAGSPFADSPLGSPPSSPSDPLHPDSTFPRTASL
jgi:tRNA-specific 2-thiouridylase